MVTASCAAVTWSPTHTGALAGLVLNARVELFEGASHLLYWEQPQRFVRAVTDFLTDPALKGACRPQPPTGPASRRPWATAWRCPGLEPGSPVGQVAQCPEHKRSIERWRVLVVALQRSAGSWRLGDCQGGREPLAEYVCRQGVVRPREAG